MDTPDLREVDDTALAWVFGATFTDLEHATVMAGQVEEGDVLTMMQLLSLSLDLAGVIRALGIEIERRGHVQPGAELIERTREWARRQCTDHPDEVARLDQRHSARINFEQN